MGGRNIPQNQQTTTTTTTNKPKEKGLITTSNKKEISINQWKNLFHLELIKERNKPKDFQKQQQLNNKSNNAPFFLQWRPGDSITNNYNVMESIVDNKKSNKDDDDDDEWESAWNDDDDIEKLDDNTIKTKNDNTSTTKK